MIATGRIAEVVMVAMAEAAGGRQMHDASIGVTQGDAK